MASWFFSSRPSQQRTPQPPPAEVLACEDLAKGYHGADFDEQALQGVSLKCAQGETCALIGPSGSGKTTLLSILGCLLTPSSGNVWIDGELVQFGSLRQLTLLRRNKLGFVFQQAQLLPFLKVSENLRIVGRNAGLASADLAQRMHAVFERLNIDRYLDRYPHQLSGGQRQRVAIARAIIHKPKIILADEPTGALDAATGQAAAKLLVEQAKLERAALIVVTHDTRIVPLFDRVERLDSGKLV